MKEFQVFFRKKHNSALQKAVIAMNDDAEFQCNKLLKLDNAMLMYRIYNAETLEKLINTVQELHNVTSSHEKLFAGEHNPTLFRILYMNALDIQQYTFNSLLFLRIVQDKYISLYKELITQLKSYISAIRMLAKGYLPTTLITPSKLQDIINEVTKSLQQTNPDYALVLDRLHLYYDMQLVTFSIDREMNLVIQFPVFIQPIHTETTNPISIRNSSGSNTRHQHRCTILYLSTCEQTIHCLKLRNIHITYSAGTEILQEDR